MTPIYRCYHQHGPAPWLSVSRDYHGALSRSPPGQCSISPRSAPSARAHITVITFRTKKQNPTRTGYPSPAHARPMTAHCWLRSRLHWARRLLSLAILLCIRRWIMSNLVSFTWIIDWKDKRVDLFTHNIDVLGSCCCVVCNSEHWTYFQGTCIRL